jgi:hypothetical protein
MQPIYPVCKESCHPHVGQRVCAVLQDGSHMYGVISNVTDSGIEFNGVAKGVEVLSKNPQKAKKQLQQIHQKAKSKIKTTAKTSAYGPYGRVPGYGYPGVGGYGLEWAAIALLFLIPFLFI